MHARQAVGEGAAGDHLPGDVVRAEQALFAAALAASPAAARAEGPHAAPGAEVQAAAPPRLTADPPVPSLLARGLAAVVFHVEGGKVMPVYGQAALGVTPKLVHLHVTVDGAGWRWVHASEEPVVIQGLAPGPHTVRLELADAAHRVIDQAVVRFDVPPSPATRP